MQLRKMYLSLLVASVFAIGCENPQFRGREKGALMGGALGAGLGAIVGNQVGDSGAGIAIGAASGALAGGLLGNEQDKSSDRQAYLEERQRRAEYEISRQKREIRELRARDR